MMRGERKEVGKERGRCTLLLANRDQINSNMRHGTGPEFK